MSEQLTPKIQCPICLYLVSEFKPNCHVIPKWVLNLTKEDGKNFVMSAAKTGPNQSDIKTQSWCEECEKAFARLDTAGAIFFRDHEKLLSQDKHPLSVYAFNNIEDYNVVRQFIMSIVARYYLYLLNDRKMHFGESIYTEVYKAFLIYEDFYFTLHDMRKFSGSTSNCPVPSFGTIQVMINGILVILTKDMIEREIYNLKPGEILVRHVTDPSTPYVKQFKELLRRSYTPELYERYKVKFADR